LEAVPIPALVTRGVIHRVEYANPAARKVLADAVPGITLADLFPPLPSRTVERIAQECFAEAAPRVARHITLYDIVPAGARWGRVDVFMTPMHDGLGKLAGLVVFLSESSTHERAPPA
jgi:hypothetical protein